ncbi:hypothetical protein FB567DRAFT_528409 [Paraphoma chrysanthemicola]|uniref:Uncharacterized protein n=1 Tax=Paraphoma chrysanthemicola TaxID=798071 RepID=A0A8K0R4U6_9PLEO|nr:hypothetical protein FB567DRAFT_528409 [Paraphoma chrysanthemicola]
MRDKRFLLLLYELYQFSPTTHGTLLKTRPTHKTCPLCTVWKSTEKMLKLHTTSPIYRLRFTYMCHAGSLVEDFEETRTSVPTLFIPAAADHDHLDDLSLSKR